MARISEERLEELRELNRTWPFFASILDNMAQVMSKADMQLTKLYSTLVGDKEIADRVYNAIAEEYTLTLEMFLKVTEQEHLLAENPALERSVRSRFPLFGAIEYYSAGIAAPLSCR